ncbi:MAG: hypothetical protein RLY98_363 [Bacteroidota bacterium]|jgi:hypothetical protein
MVKNTNGNYSDSVRTSGEVECEFIRDKEVICKLILFIGSKNTTFFITRRYFCVF